MHTTFQVKTSPERRQEQGETLPPTEMSSPPPLPSRPEEADGSCDCGSTDPATKPSAWEQASSSVLNGNDNSGTGSTGVRVSRVSVSPAETLDLRIFCGTWNVAGLRVTCIKLGFATCAHPQQQSKAEQPDYSCLASLICPPFGSCRSCAHICVGLAGCLQQYCTYLSDSRIEYHKLHLKCHGSERSPVSRILIITGARVSSDCSIRNVWGRQYQYPTDMNTVSMFSERANGRL